MKTLRLIVLTIAIAVISSGAAVFFLKSDFLGSPGFKERWIASERAGTMVPAPAAFASLNVVDNSRDVLTFDEQESLFNGFGDKLVDPVSAQVRMLVRSKTKDLIVCGEVNAKNKFGGYVGFTPFFAGVFPQKAMIVLAADREVGQQLPRMGCPDFNAVGTPDAYPASKSNKTNVSRGPQQLAGRVTALNFEQLSSFIVDNYERIVELKISIGKSNGFEDPLQAFDDGTKFETYINPDSTIVISIFGGYLLERGSYNFKGFYRVKWRALLQGAAIVELEQLVGNQVIRDTPAKTVELKE